MFKGKKNASFKVLLLGDKATSYSINLRHSNAYILQLLPNATSLVEAQDQDIFPTHDKR